MVHNANFDKNQLNALDLLNALVEHKLETIFPNLIISLRMFLTAPATKDKTVGCFLEVVFSF